MDKLVILSVAGSGKTSLIIKSLTLEKRFLIISYTIANTENIKARILKKFGFLPKNIKVYTYFSFLYSFCFKPIFYKKIDNKLKIKIKGITYKSNPNFTTKTNAINHYISKNQYLYSNRISKLIIKSSLKKEVFERIEKYFDSMYIDEIQDFGGNDFNFIKEFSELNIEVVFVGDYYQHTFDTSSDGNTNKNLFSCYDKYIKTLEKCNFKVNTKTLSNSYRCTSSVCEFISNNLGINISSNNSKKSEISEILDDKKIADIIRCENTVKLFYQEHHKFNIYSNNWGNSKGLDCYNDVCIILNQKSYDLYTQNNLIKMANTSKNKLYVACSRSKNNIFFISEKKFKQIYNDLNSLKITTAVASLGADGER